MKMQVLSLETIRVDGDINPRVVLNLEALADYRDLYAAGDHPLPALCVFLDEEGTYWLSRGFHRFSAAQSAGLKSLDCEVRKGSHWDAYLDARLDTAGEISGVRRTAADRRKIIEGFLSHEESRKWTQQEIADASLCSLATVRRVVKDRQNAKSDAPEGGKSSPELLAKSGGKSQPSPPSVPSSVQAEGERAEALAKCVPAIQKGVNSGAYMLLDEHIKTLAALTTDQQNIVARELRLGSPFKTALEKAGAKAPKKAKAGGNKPKKPKPPIKALQGAEREAWEARQQIKVWADTIGRWAPDIDKYREKYPGKAASGVQGAAKALYEGLNAWGKGIK